MSCLNGDLFSWTVFCNNCIHCKTRGFTEYDKFIVWLESKELKPRSTWKRKFRTDNSIVVNVYWCKKDSNNRVVITRPGPGLRSKEKCWFYDGDDDEQEKI